MSFIQSVHCQRFYCIYKSQNSQSSPTVMAKVSPGPLLVLGVTITLYMSPSEALMLQLWWLVVVVVVSGDPLALEV